MLLPAAVCMVRYFLTLERTRHPGPRNIQASGELWNSDNFLCFRQVFPVLEQSSVRWDPAVFPSSQYF